MITSVRNRQIVTAARLQKRGIREQHRRFLVEGAQATSEALAAGAVETLFHVPGAGGRVADVVRRAGEAGVRLTAVSDTVMSHLTSTVTPQPLVAVARFVDTALEGLDAAEGIVPLLCSVRDPGNAGTIVRTADAAGAAGVVFAEASVDVYNPKTVRASAGSIFHLPVVREVTAADAVAAFRERGFHVVAAAAGGRESVFDADLAGPTVVLFGNEAWGLPPEIEGLADGTVRVPITGEAESLNLAAAATVVLFEAARQRAGDDVAATLSEAAHDLRAPLVGMRGFSSTLAAHWDELDEERRREGVGLVAFDAERGAAMLELVLAIARGAAGRGSARGSLDDVGRQVVTAFAGVDERPEVAWSASGEVGVDARTLHAMVFVFAEIAASAGADRVVVTAEPSAESVTLVAPRPAGNEAQSGSLALLRGCAAAVGGALETDTPDRLLLRLPR